MPFPHQKILAMIFTAIVLDLASLAFSNPGVAACALIDFNSFVQLADGTLVKTDSGKKNSTVVFEHLILEAKNRIQQTFGPLNSRPIVVFFDNPTAFWPLKPNEYGSTNFIGSRTCVMIGPKGQNHDVVAHELMHAEIAYRVGWWGRLTQLPVWFDEGLAMQVDWRPRYVLSGGANAETKTVRALNFPGDFFLSDDQLLTKNYAFAKSEVALWVNEVGKASVYKQLERIRLGESFNAIVQNN